MTTKGLLTGTVFGQPAQTNLVECSTYVPGGTDWLQSDVASLSIGSVWTIAWWQKRPIDPQTSDAVLWDISGADGVDGRIKCTHNYAAQELAV